MDGGAGINVQNNFPLNRYCIIANIAEYIPEGYTVYNTRIISLAFYTTSIGVGDSTRIVGTIGIEGNKDIRLQLNTERVTARFAPIIIPLIAIE